MPTPSGQPLSTMATWSATIVRALDSCGLDGRAIAARAGIGPDLLADPEGRVPRDALTRLWELAVADSGDPAFGLLAARHTLQTTFHALGYAVLASATLREAIGRIIRHQRLIGGVVQLRLDDDADAPRFTIDVSAGRGIVPWPALDAFVAVTVRQARLLVGSREFAPAAISLQRPVPGDPSVYARELRAPVAFAQPATFVAYRRDDLDRPLPSANAELARRNDEVAAQYLERLAGSSALAAARKTLLDMLPSGAPSRPQLAKRLAVSPRALQRLLAAEGTSFTALLADARLELARNYLEEGRMPVTEVAFVLGFADTSAFSRAFRRWTGVAPSDWARSPRPR